MAFQFITGSFLVDKPVTIIHKFVELKKQQPEAKIYYLVPDHIKFDMEERMLKELRQLQGRSSAAMTDIQVASFKRLAWFLLPKSFNQKPQLSQIGNAMLIQAILLQEKDHLRVYRGQIYHQGFIDKLLKLFEELYEANIQPDDLQRIVEQMADPSWQQNPNENQRLVELAYLYAIYRQKINDQSLDNYQDFERLQAYLNQEDFSRNYYAIIDHFQAFNAQEIALIRALARNFNHVYLSLPLSHHQANQASYQPVYQLIRETYQQIKRILLQEDIEIKADWEISQPIKAYRPEIIQTSQMTLNVLNQNQSLSRQDTANYQEIWSCDSIQTELRHLANQINYLVKVKKYRYQDIIIKTRHLDDYQHIIEPYFNENQIPIFFDHQQTMQGHSLVSLIESIFQLVLGYWQIDDIINILKSDLVQLEGGLDRQEFFHQVNLFENILLANGFQGYRFFDPNFNWHFSQEDQVYVNQQGQEEPRQLKEIVLPIRQRMIQIFTNRYLAWQDSMTGQEASQWLYQLLIKLGVRERLILKRDQAIEAGNIEDSRHDEQVWQVLITMLDEFHLIFKDQAVDFASFKNLLLSGFKQASFHIIPPTIDQVVFTSIESPQAKDFKIAFIVGMDELALPSHPKTDSLINADQREQINGLTLHHQFLRDPARLNYRQDLWLAYQNLLSGQDYLYISYHQGESKQDLQLSPYYRPLVLSQRMKLFSFNAFQPLSQTGEHPSLLGQANIMIGSMLFDLGQFIQARLDAGQVLNQNLLTLYRHLNPSQQASFIDAISQLLSFSNLPQAIEAKTALALYGQNLISSVSKIETFFQDPFAHFIVYGLRLQERAEYQITPIQAGDYFHEFLDRFVKAIQTLGLELGKLSPDQLRNIFQHISQVLDEDVRFNIFASQARHRFIQRMIQRQIEKSLQSFTDQFSQIHLQPMLSEAVFGLGPDHNLKPVEFQLPSGGRLRLTGKIDRIDWQAEDKLLQIIDYKTGNKSFNLADFYYGLDLQIMTYLYVAQQTFPDLQPIGAFYQPLMQKYLKADSADLLSAQQTNFQINRLAGLVTIGPDQLQKIDQGLMEQGQSQYYPAKITKSGTYHKKASQYIEAQDLKLIYQHLEKLFVQAGQQIQSGNIALRPFYEDPYSLSLQKGYRVLTGFDPTIHFSAYRHQTISKEQVIQQIILDSQESEERYD
ncbi:PD-(D/E)XK nuclease family protein [Ignavigranum ruoffiae]